MRPYLQILLSLLLCITSTIPAQINIQDSLKKLLQSSVHDTIKYNMLNAMIEAEQDDNIWPIYNQSLKELAEKNLKKENDPLKKYHSKFLADAWNNIGYLAQQHGEPAKALQAYNKCVEIYHTVHDQVGLSVTLNNIGGIYKNVGDYQKAIAYYYNSLKIKEEIGDKKSAAVSLLNIAAMHDTQKDYHTALEIYNKALAISKENDDKPQIAHCYEGMAQSYYYLDSLDLSMKLVEKALKLGTEINNKRIIANELSLMGNIYFEKNDLDRALQMFRQSSALFREIKDKRQLTINACKIGQVFLQKNNLAMAEAYGIEGLTSAKEVSYPKNIAIAAQLLKNIYKKQNKPAKALEMMELQVAMKDSIWNQQNRTDITKKLFQHEAEQKEQEIKLLESRNLLLNEKAGKRKLYILLIASGALFLITMLALIGTYRKKRQKMELAKNKAEFELQALMAQMNPHFIFNALNSIQHFILEKGKQDAYDYLAKFSKLIRMVLNHSEDKLVSLKNELDLIKLYVELEQLRFENGFDFQLNISKEVAEENTELPTMVIQPYIENAIWHGLMNLNSERKGILKVDVLKEKSDLKIVIEDNGVGRIAAAKYRKDNMYRPAGMKLTQNRLNMINQVWGYKSAMAIITDLENNQGTRVEITLPLHEQNRSHS